MSIKGKAYIAGIYECPDRKIDDDRSIPQLHAEFARGALADAGLTKDDVDGYLVGGDAPGGLGLLSQAEYMGLNVRYMDSTTIGGSTYIAYVAHAANAIAAGKCNVCLITAAARTGRGRPQFVNTSTPAVYQPADAQFEAPYGVQTANLYAMVAMRHMADYGTTSEQLAWVKVAASHHAQHNPHAALPDVVSVEDVVNSPMITDPLHRLDCCMNTDGGGAMVVVSEGVARELERPRVKVIGAAEAAKHQIMDPYDLTYSAARWTGPIAFDMAGVTPQDIKYVGLYDSFTITVITQLEDLGFCEKGKGGAFVADGNLISGSGSLPFNTDGGGLCSNHPGGQGGLVKTIEGVRQLRGEAHPAVQVANCDLAFIHGIGGFLGTRHSGTALILERE